MLLMVPELSKELPPILLGCSKSMVPELLMVPSEEFSKLSMMVMLPRVVDVPELEIM